MGKIDRLTKILHNFNKGANGGSPSARLWFCGLENGSGNNIDFQRSHNEQMLADDEYEHMPYDEQNFMGFNGKLRRLVHQKLEFMDYPKTIEEMYSSDAFYCTNLCPLAFQNEYDGDAEIQKLTGISSKEEYKKYCIDTRRADPKWQKFIAPARVIVCTHKPSRDDFIRLFMINDKTSYSSDIPLLNGDSTAEIIRNKNRTLIICPHPSSWNWNESINCMAEIIKKELKKDIK